MYFQVVLAEPDQTSGIPEYLRLITKPAADAILAGLDAQTHPREALLRQGGGLIARDLTEIAAELGKCICSKKMFDDGEPYATLSRYLAADTATLNRHHYAAHGAPPRSPEASRWLEHALMRGQQVD